MKIGIDVRYALHTRRGIGNYVLNLLRSLAKIDDKNEYLLYSDIEDTEGILPQHPNFKLIHLSLDNGQKESNQTKSKFFALWEQFVLPQQAKRDALNILHCPGNTGPLFLDKSIDLIVTIHDVMFSLPNSVLPQTQSLYQSLFRAYCKWLAPQIADRASAVITVSNYSKQDIIKYLNVKPDKISVTYEGIDSKFKIGDYENINSKFILAFGGHEIRKNCLRIIDAFSVFSQKNTDINLVLCGVKDDYKKHIDSYINMQNIRDRVTLLPYISDEDLVKLYNQAEMLLYPSLYEGFGFPILESMACGTPVIASNTTSIPEISGNCALLIDPLNTEEIANSLLQLSEDTELRQQLIQQGKQRSAKFSWHNTAEETKKLYESIRRTQHSSK